MMTAESIDRQLLRELLSKPAREILQRNPEAGKFGKAAAKKALQSAYEKNKRANTRRKRRGE